MLALILLFALVAPRAFPLPTNHDHDHPHSFEVRLPETWHHASSHPAHTLFTRRQSAIPVGSPAWAATFPSTPADVAKLPRAWADALATAVAAGSIPDIPVSTDTGASPIYPTGLNPADAEICSATYKCKNPEDVWDAPDGVFGVSFDDGPLPFSDRLYDYLESQHVHATHFMIGSNIIHNPARFDRAFRILRDDIAVHTWTHPHMTTLPNERVVGELGYTIQAIYDLTGGRLPRYWRPPYGDSDNRVRAIAQAVFGLETIIWNRDSEDWTLANNRTTPEAIHEQLEQWFLGPKSPGLMVLEHELSDLAVQAFIDAFPIAKGAGWKILPLSQFGKSHSAYRNAAGNTGRITSTPLVVPTGAPPPRPSTASTPIANVPAANASETATVLASPRPSSTLRKTSATPAAAQAHSSGGLPWIITPSGTIPVALSCLAAIFFVLA